MRCPNRTAMQSFVDDELDSRAADAIGAHLAVCPRCRDAVDAVRRRARTVRRSLDEAWPVVAAPPPAARAATPGQRFAATGAPRSIWRRHLRIPIPLLAAAGLLIAGLSTVIWRQHLTLGELRATRQPPVTTVTIAAGGTILQREIVLDLSRCQPVEDTTVYVFREE
ncbi:MAG TPA: zf-HC2 domain-containing protein [Acidobacteriota bacterium]|nr:zf-HC2 domain-containing protein [Acidobacteriota bacterium]HQM62796.1 zf-HC2 domain-containing protein [Acidobacteriota bacterium]